MSFVRPELTLKLTRWRESLAGAAASAFGLYLSLTTGGAAFLIGIVLTVGGALLLVAGIQRARFRRGGDGPGVVQVDEGRLAYFGPVEGGTIAIDDMTRVDLVRTGSGPVWEIGGGPERLCIPVSAVGAEALFDVFGALPGLDTALMLRAVEASEAERTPIWVRSQTTPRLGAH